MKLTHKYLNPIIVFFAVYMFGYLLYNAGISLTRAVYTYMNHIFPESFPLYEKLAEKLYRTGLEPLGIADEEENLDARLSELTVIFLVGFCFIVVNGADCRHHRRIYLSVHEYSRTTVVISYFGHNNPPSLIDN